MQSTRKCEWEEYWGQEYVERRLKNPYPVLDSYIRNRKKKARESAQIICESRRRHPRFQVDRRAEIWKKIDAQEDAMKRMYDLVGDLPRMEGEFLSNEF